jgi:hypothetical protein
LPIQIETERCDRDLHGTAITLHSLHGELAFPDAARMRQVLIFEYACPCSAHAVHMRSPDGHAAHHRRERLRRASRCGCTRQTPERLPYVPPGAEPRR